MVIFRYQDVPPRASSGGKPSVLYPEGTLLTCPHCGHVFARAMRDILTTDPADKNDWESPYELAGFHSPCPNFDETHDTDQVQQHIRIRGQRMEVHTQDGWR